MATGTVKWFNAQKGYGFIQPADGGKDVFVHARDLQKSSLSGLEQDQNVVFEVYESDKGPRATNIKLQG